MTAERTEPLFALDIGTRTVVGLVAFPGPKGLVIKATEILEHQTRSMLDGQIHDVPLVADLLRTLRARLEKRVGHLSRVAVAAAGRALKTYRGRAVRPLQGTRPDAEGIRGLELEALEQAQRQLMDEPDQRGHYHCVGYSVVGYRLDDAPIGNLLGQSGFQAEVEVIGTFLPKVVVDSLHAALEAAGLEMQALTLEPIAAIHALIPASMRKLNLALVDVGAGTSDIALTAEGTVTAYGMVPCAGDEVTEALAERWLLDFDTAEAVKRKWSDDYISFSDVLGHTKRIAGQELVESMTLAVEHLAELIAREILSLNQRPPMAVLLIGGGSLTPGLPAALASRLGLPQDRVAVRSVDQVRGFARIPAKLKGPDGVTPLGIALAALEQPVHTAVLKVGNTSLRLFDFRPLTIGDALLHAGVNMRSLFGRPGAALTVTVNGEGRIIPGIPGTGPQLFLNGSPAGLDTPVEDGDAVTVTPGRDGTDAQCVVGDLIPDSEGFSIRVNGEERVVGPRIRMNGEPVDRLTPVVDRSIIQAYVPEMLKEILEDLGWPDAFTVSEIRFRWNGEPVVYAHPRYRIHHNGKEARPESVVAQGDRIDIVETAPAVLTDWLRKARPRRLPARPSLTLEVNGEPVLLEAEESAALHCNGRSSGPDAPLRDGDQWEEVPAVGPSEWIVSDLFRFVNPDDLRSPDSRVFHVEVNGTEASFAEPLRAGDRVRLYWT
ncbi:MAG: cell division FtsA domain-containing protein [Kyrpidia sp.]|nr:cell division FtsA domain-containing protein [Kyrpidia sp.]